MGRNTEVYVSSLHWLILFPYYFFTALSLYLLFSLICRLVRAEASANSLAMTAVVGSVIATATPILIGSVPLASYSWPGLVALLVISSALAVADAVFKGSLPLALDEELEDV
jgi:cyanate permease